jgi:hypothetical protein
METKIIDFLVKGSAEEPYKVTFIEQELHDKQHFAAFCTCKAGQIGQVCKHRMNIFYGDTKNIVEGDLKSVEFLSNWYENSIYKHINDKIKKLEKVVKKAQSNLRSEKKELQHWMNQIKTKES